MRHNFQPGLVDEKHRGLQGKQATTSRLLFLALACCLSLFAACRDHPTEPNQVIPATADPAKDALKMLEATPTILLATKNPVNPENGFDCSKIDQISAVECEALVALFINTSGTDWAENTGWLSSNYPCTWSGITCTGTHISHINLSDNQLTGTLPPELGNITGMVELALWDNQLHGPIPVQLGRLSRLVSLQLSSNQLTGSIPTELKNLKNLQTLSLAFNRLDGSIPSELGELTGLELIDLSYNQISGSIPEELGDLANLQLLYLSHNKLSGTIPTNLGVHEKLTWIDLSYNQLSGSVPEHVAHIPRSALWGNQILGTFPGDEAKAFRVDYMGIRFSADPSLASSIWPEVIPATSASEGAPPWLYSPQHIRFTFANPHLSPGRSRMGINLEKEGQILIFPLGAMVEIDPWGSERVEKIKSLLEEREPVLAGELPLFPLNNAFQVFHAQEKYLETEAIQGLRFITQYTQDNIPAINNNDVFYTFQGLSNDGGCYIAVFFPLTTAVLPDKMELEDWDFSKDNYESYVVETTALLDQLPPPDFMPDLTLLDSMVTSIRLIPNDRLCSTLQPFH